MARMTSTSAVSLNHRARSLSNHRTLVVSAICVGVLVLLLAGVTLAQALLMPVSRVPSTEHPVSQPIRLAVPKLLGAVDYARANDIADPAKLTATLAALASGIEPRLKADLDFVMATPGSPDLDAIRTVLQTEIDRQEGETRINAERQNSARARSARLAFYACNIAMVLVVVTAIAGAAAALERGSVERQLAAARISVLKAERDRASFLAVAGHDLRQPLQAIDLFLGSLRASVVDPPSVAVMDRIAAASEAMRDIITGLLDLAKLDAGLVVADFVNLPLDTALARLRDEFEPLLKGKQVELRLLPTSAVAFTDPFLFKTVLRNLILNALNHTDAGSVTLSAAQDGDAVLVCVEDTGIGIPSGEQASIFKDFYRLQRRSAGLGLGLGIVARTVTLLRGSIAVESSVGVGSLFTVSLPAGSLRELRPAERGCPVDWAGNRVLVVDDDAELRNQLCKLVGSWSATVAATGSVADALALVRSSGGTRPSFLILDHDLQDGTGFALLQQLRATGYAGPALFVSALAEPATLHAVRQAGYEICPKPVDGDQLRRMADQAVLRWDANTTRRT